MSETHRALNSALRRDDVNQPTGRPDFLFELGGPRFWGDYGDVLIGGAVFEADDEGNPVDYGQTGDPVIERTGPFVPPISDGGCGYAVTNDFKLQLEGTGLRGLEFRHLRKLKIVEIRWENWDKTQPLSEPWQLPVAGPFSYLSEGVHSKEIANRMPKLWELIPPRVCEFYSEDAPDGSFLGGRLAISWSLSQIGELDFCRGLRSPGIYVSARGKAWLEERAAEWLEFRAQEVVD